MNSDYKLLIQLQKILNQLNDTNTTFFVVQCNQKDKGRQYFLLRKNNIENKKAVLFVYHKKDGSEIYVLPTDIIKEMMELKMTKTATINLESLRKMVSIIEKMKRLSIVGDADD